MVAFVVDDGPTANGTFSIYHLKDAVNASLCPIGRQSWLFGQQVAQLHDPLIPMTHLKTALRPRSFGPIPHFPFACP